MISPPQKKLKYTVCQHIFVRMGERGGGGGGGGGGENIEIAFIHAIVFFL